MSRSMDLDKVAPDDQVIVSSKNDANMVREEEKKIREETNLSETKGVKEKIYDIIGHTKHSLSSILINPDVFSFEEKDDEEEILLVARPHWITNLSWILITVLLIIGPSLLKFIPLVGEIPAKFQMIGIFAWYMVTFAFAFEKFLSWYFDVYIITDERVIDINFNNLLDKKFSEAKLSMIQDITSRVSGISQTMFNYGNVYIQTAAEIPEITFEMVPNPEKIIKVLQMMREEEEKETLEGRVR